MSRFISSENELWLHETFEKIRQICENLCQLDFYLGKRLNEIWKDVPICETSEDKQLLEAANLNGTNAQNCVLYQMTWPD